MPTNIVLVMMSGMPIPINTGSRDGGLIKFGGAPLGFNSSGILERSKDGNVAMVPDCKMGTSEGSAKIHARLRGLKCPSYQKRRPGIGIEAFHLISPQAVVITKHELYNRSPGLGTVPDDPFTPCYKDGHLCML